MHRLTLTPRERSRVPYETEGNVELARLWYERAQTASPGDASVKEALQKLVTADAGSQGKGTPAAASDAKADPSKERTGFWHIGLAGVTGARSVWWGNVLAILFFIGGMVQAVANIPKLRQSNPAMPAAVIVVSGIVGGAFWYIVFWGLPEGGQWGWFGAFMLVYIVAIVSALKASL